MDRSKDADEKLDELIVRALNKIRKPSTAEEIAELLNRELGARDQFFDAMEVENWLRSPRQSCSTLLAGNASSPVSFFLVSPSQTASVARQHLPDPGNCLGPLPPIDNVVVDQTQLVREAGVRSRLILRKMKEARPAYSCG
jgi:hypothetical protein